MLAASIVKFLEFCPIAEKSRSDGPNPIEMRGRDSRQKDFGMEDLVENEGRFVIDDVNRFDTPSDGISVTYI